MTNEREDRAREFKAKTMRNGFDMDSTVSLMVAFAEAEIGRQAVQFNDAIPLTKREYFAAMAMQSLALNTALTWRGMAEGAVKAADALIEALNK